MSRCFRALVLLPVAALASCPPPLPDEEQPDLMVDAPRMERSAYLEWRFFEEGDCALRERCVLAPGWRRLLRFTTEIRNVGTAPVFLGSPYDNPDFDWDECHEHFHRLESLDYELFDASGERLTVGRKQSYCWVDTRRVPEMPLTSPLFPNDGESCQDNQGLTNGWADVYRHDLDCQWVDVTGLPPGDYLLRVTVNPGLRIVESDYDNNAAEVLITLDDGLPRIDGVGRAF